MGNKVAVLQMSIQLSLFYSVKISPMARPFWTYHTFDLDLIFKVKTGDWNLTLSILKCGTFWHWCTEKLLIMHVDTFGQYLLGATKWGHSDLWPLTYRPKLTSPMLTKWGTEMAVLQSILTDHTVLWYQNITHDKAFLDIPYIWPWPHFQGHNRHLTLSVLKCSTFCSLWYVPLISTIFIIIYPGSIIFSFSRLLWPCLRSPEVNMSPIRNALGSTKKAYSRLPMQDRLYKCLTKE